MTPPPEANLSAQDNQPELSIVVPALNEQDNVGPLVDEVRTALREQGIDTELIVVDDGSTDQTLPRLLELSRANPWVRPLHREKAQGQSAATHAGIAVAHGKYVGFLDADLQNDPADLARMVVELRKGSFDMMQGYRAKRQDNIKRKFSSWVGRTTRKLLLGDAIRDTGCSTRVMKREFAAQLPLIFKGMHRFMPVYAKMLGARLSEIPVNHRPRTSGVTKYGTLSRAAQGLVDCLAVRWMTSRHRSWAATEMKPAEAK
jgi:dolichol-phosphate mannosyltransferase